jgi:hypothetical protein
MKTDTVMKRGLRRERHHHAGAFSPAREQEVAAP